MRKDAQRDRPVSKDEIVVTPDMVSAGVAELASWGRGDDLANIAERGGRANLHSPISGIST